MVRLRGLGRALVQCNPQLQGHTAAASGLASLGVSHQQIQVGRQLAWLGSLQEPGQSGRQGALAAAAAAEEGRGRGLVLRRAVAGEGRGSRLGAGRLQDSSRVVGV